MKKSISSIVTNILNGCSVRSAVLENPSKGGEWNMSLPGEPDFRKRVEDMLLRDSDFYDFELKEVLDGPKDENGMPEYLDVKLYTFDYSDGKYFGWYQYVRYFPDGTSKTISESEYGKNAH